MELYLEIITNNYTKYQTMMCLSATRGAFISHGVPYKHDVTIDPPITILISPPGNADWSSDMQ